MTKQPSLATQSANSGQVHLDARDVAELLAALA
jgi:hypothetical protein